MERQKLYVFVDETGQDTKGRLFVATAVVMAGEQENTRQLLERIERETGKGKRKWTASIPRQRHAYTQQIFQQDLLRGRLFYGYFERTTIYHPCIIETIAGAIESIEPRANYQATILIDGLKKNERNPVALDLRKRGIRVKKVRGVRDESDPLLRLADAMAGFVRDGIEERADTITTFQTAIRSGFIQRIEQ
jgi:Protein of unknown function (DUF3800)